ncbi:uncharacterized protein LOC127578154 [Pristis pectinata]|uniref:uncharacterized protein LOC127578154 n=1 Tax=Pristis pectinata TaxID=685728 RepID=UPI00223CA50A|nr:uncharacterized protein LOC127578154 [Pristis pectinata]
MGLTWSGLIFLPFTEGWTGVRGGGLPPAEFIRMLSRRGGSLALLVAAVLLVGSSAGAEPGTCGTVSLCWDIASSITFAGKLYLNHNNVLDAGRIRKSGSWWLEPRGEHVLHFAYMTQSLTWRIYTMCPPHIEKLSDGNVTEIQGVEATEQSFLFQRNARLGCEGEVLYFFGTNDMSLAIVSADWFPLKINTVPTGLSLSWELGACFLKDLLCALLLYDVDGNNLHQEIIRGPNLDIPGLTPCTHYIVCLNITEHNICAITITDPLPASNLSLTASNSNSITIYWDKPALGDVDWFQLDVGLLGQNREATESPLQSYGLTQSGAAFLIDGLPACQWVRVSLVSVCEGATVKESTKVSLVAETALKFVKLAQTAASADGYGVSWSVSGDPSQVFFQVYRNGHLQLTQNQTEYVSTGLGPCTKEMFTLEAVCRNGPMADRRSITVSTAPDRVSNLIYKQTIDGGFFSWRSPPVHHGICVQVDNTSVAFTKRSYYQVSGLSACTRYQYTFQATCGQWLSEGTSWVAVTGCPIEARPSDRKSIIALPNKIHVRIHFPWQFADYMNDPSSRVYQKLAGVSSSKVGRLLLDSGKLSSAEVELLDLVKGSDAVEMDVAADVRFNSTPASLEHLLSDLGDSDVSAVGGALFWNDEDECPSVKNDCPVGSDCINTFDSFTCVCHQGYFDPNHQSRACRDHGVFTNCRMDLMKISVSKEFLADQAQRGLNLVLNDGVCGVEEELDFYTFTVTDTKTYCGGQLQMNETHQIFKHVITNEYHSESPIIREPPLMFTVNCAYSKSSLAKMPLDMIPQIRMLDPIVGYNRDPLQLAIFLYKDDTFSPDAMYGEAPTIELNEDLYLEVGPSLTESSEAAFVLEVVSCWATVAADLLGRQVFQFLQDGCPVDETFRWYSINGLSSSTRFAIKMFHFTEMANCPIYLHCRAKICNVEAATDCLTECPSPQIHKRQEQRGETTPQEPVTGLVSTGPIELQGTNWHQMKPLLWIIGSVTGTSLLMVVAVVAMKVINSRVRFGTA